MGLKPAAAAVYAARNDTRHRMLLAGRRFGKSMLSMLELITEAVEQPGSRCHYLAPTLVMGRSILWEALQQQLPESWVRSTNQTRMELRLRNGSIIRIGALDHADALRGQSSSFLVLDEWCFGKDVRLAWGGALRPMLSTTKGRTLWISTPAGADPWCRDQYDLAGNHPSWRRWDFQSVQGGWIDSSEIEEARAEMDADLFRQEYCAQWVSFAGRVFPLFGDDNIGTVADRGGQLIAGLDFNVSPFVCVVGQHGPDGGLEILREVVLNDADTDQMAVKLRRLYPGRPIAIAPDPTGARRQTSSMGLTDHAILRQHGLTVVAPKAPWRIADKITTARWFIRSSDGRRRLRIDPGCKQLISSLRGLEFADGKSIPDQASQHSHAADSLGYLCLALRHGLLPYQVGAGPRVPGW